MNDCETTTAIDQAEQKLLDELPVPYLEVDRNGVITRANHAAQQLAPSGATSLVGRLAWEGIAADEMAASFASFCSLLESGEAPAVVRRSIYVAAGEFRVFELHRALIHDRSGSPIGMRILGMDVTGTVKLLEESRSAALWLHSVVAALPDPVLIADAMGVVRSVNPAAEALFGWLPNAFAGKLLETILPMARVASQPELRLNFDHMLAAPHREPVLVIDSRGVPVAMDLASSPIFDVQSGNLTGLICTLHARHTAAQG